MGILLGLRGVFPVVVCPCVCKCEPKESKMLIEMLIGITAGATIISAIAFAVWMIAPYAEYINELFRRR